MKRNVTSFLTGCGKAFLHYWYCLQGQIKNSAWFIYYDDMTLTNNFYDSYIPLFARKCPAVPHRPQQQIDKWIGTWCGLRHTFDFHPLFF